MKFSISVFLALCAGSIVLSLDGCGGGGPPLNMPSRTAAFDRLRSDSPDTAARLLGDGALVKGWARGKTEPNVNPQATFTCNGPCVYVSDIGAGAVNVYAYQSRSMGPVVATLTGFNGPDGICVGKSKAPGTAGKNVIWIVNNSGSDVYGFLYGKTAPTYKVSVLKPRPGYVPVSCSLDPVTGDLAVSDIGSVKDGMGNLSIFTPKEQAVNNGGPSEQLSVGTVYRYYFVAYDEAGNLFADGLDKSAKNFEFAEFPHGTAPGKAITLNERFLRFPGQVQYDAKTTWMEVNDQEPNGNVAYEFKIAGTTGTEKLSASLSGACDAVGTWHDGLTHTLFVPDSACPALYAYDYPAGGEPRQGLLGSTKPIGAAVLR